ncbi:MAG: L,D-transpeptidase [Eubacterium sp.]|nr:L,D-transpeptidase [Eubacterium sp.]
MKRKRKLKSWVWVLLWIIIGGGCISLFLMACNKTTTPTKEIETTLVPSTTEEPETEEEITTEPETEEINTPDYEQVIDFDADLPFMVKVNRARNFVTIYGIDYEGHYTIPYKVFICSTAKEPEDTPLGTFEISEKKRWNFMVDATYTQYAIRVYGQIMLHSIPYEEMSNDTLLYEEYNKLGTAASHGCIRMQVNDVKWIFANCPEGTPVKIYSKKKEEPPLPLPAFEQIAGDDERKGWDPTDPDKLNPWKH